MDGGDLGGSSKGIFAGVPWRNFQRAAMVGRAPLSVLAGGRVLVLLIAFGVIVIGVKFIPKAVGCQAWFPFSLSRSGLSDPRACFMIMSEPVSPEVIVVRQKVGIVAGEIVDAVRSGVQFARYGYAVRIFTPQADLTELPAHLFAARADVAIIVTDGTTEREVQAEAALHRWGAAVGEDVLPVERERPDPFHPLEGVDLSNSGGTLVLVGSYMPQARAQVERLADEGALVLTLHREAVLNRDESYLMGIRSGAAAAIKQGRNVVVRSENWLEALMMTRRLAAKRGIPVDVLESRVREMLARVGQGVVQAAGARQLIVVGTETSATVCRLLGMTEMVLLREIAPGLPFVLVPGPSPLLLVLKSGTSGEPDVLTQAAAHLANVTAGV